MLHSIFLYFLKGFIISLKIPIIFIRLDFYSLSCTLLVLGYAGSRISVLGRCHMDMTLVDCVLKLSFANLVVSVCSLWRMYQEGGPHLAVPGEHASTEEPWAG